MHANSEVLGSGLSQKRGRGRRNKSKRAWCFFLFFFLNLKTKIWAHLSPIVNEVKASHPSIEVVHFFSDGPTTQYRQKGNFYLFTTELVNRGFKRGTWNFFEASHGKGDPDGVGGLLKWTADRLVS